MTANAFTSVSVDPPLVPVSIDHRAKMHRLCPDTRRFGVSVPASSQERVAWHFAGRPLPSPGELFVHDDLGLVESLDSRPGEPLLFHRGAFGRVSPHEPDLEQTWGW
jgi:hypothetical protein